MNKDDITNEYILSNLEFFKEMNTAKALVERKKSFDSVITILYNTFLTNPNPNHIAIIPINNNIEYIKEELIKRGFIVDYNFDDAKPRNGNFDDMIFSSIKVRLTI